MGNRNFHPTSVLVESKLKLGRCSAAPDLLSLAQITCSALTISVGPKQPWNLQELQGGARR